MTEHASLFEMEKFSKNIYRIRLSYIDICNGDLITGALLGQIVYWFEPSDSGKSKLGATYYGRRALAKARGDWYDEIRITDRQYDRAIKTLIEKGYVEVVNSMFDGKRTPFIMLNDEVVASDVRALLRGGTSELLKVSERYDVKCNTANTESVTPLTESTTKTTTKKRYTVTSNDGYVFDFYLQRYNRRFIKDHPTITYEQMDELKQTIIDVESEHCLEVEDWLNMVDEHFDNLPKGNNGNILYFLSGDSMQGVIRRYAEGVG